MARIFTIRFSFESSEHSALVTERVLPIATEYSLSILNSELADLLNNRKVLLLPTGTLAFTKKEGLPGRLMDIVLQTIAQHVGTDAA
ncbi:MAG: hypothetical protein EOO15_23915 [Chitinophagaceae bacterium]|nr:MAG: hypothetical protein EOO15_23915 [Chitinophagaceae bacterium]